MKWIDALLNRVTMYRLLIYVLAALFAIATIFGYLGVLSFNGFQLLFTAGILLLVCLAVNRIFANVFGAPVHDDSAYITALILALIITPARSFDTVVFLFWAATLAMSSKYILAFRKQHILNPAAFAVALTALTIGHAASWWIASLPMLPFVVVGGLLLARKQQQGTLITVFTIAALATMVVTGLEHKQHLFSIVQNAFTISPLLFFAFVMLTEPLTMPPTKTLRILYAALVGVLFAPLLHVGTVYTSPELALLAGNFLFFLVAPRKRYTLTLVAKEQVTPNVLDFVFSSKRKLSFRPGQYLEWMVPHTKVDNRGLRRFFTVASSPTERDYRIGVKFYTPSSSYKSALQSLKVGAQIVASNVAGDFTLPRDRTKKIVFLAGGIGITPFRSMIQYLLDTNDRRTMTLFYANQKAHDVAYYKVFNAAEARLGLQSVYTLSDLKSLPANWNGERGPITGAMIQRYVPDFLERMFYVSGPHAMVKAYEKVVQELGVPQSQIKIDFFPGFA